MTRILKLILKFPFFKGANYSSPPALKDDAAVARQAAAESMVLLRVRNQGQALPLTAGRKLALFGNTSYSSIAGGTGNGDVNRALYHFHRTGIGCHWFCRECAAQPSICPASQGRKSEAA